MGGPIKKDVTIGDCRLILGDCLEVMPLLGKVDAVVTDPPYGMSFQSNRRATSHKPIVNDSTTELLDWACSGLGVHSNYVWMRWDNLASVPAPKSLVTWVKDKHSMGDLKHEHGRQTEVCAFYPGLGHYFPETRPNDVIRLPRTGNNYHSTEKPVGLMMAVVRWTSGLVCDPFMGSGTTLVACAKLGRKGIGIELDPDYFEIACKRVEEAYRQPDILVHYQPRADPIQADMFNDET